MKACDLYLIYGLEPEMMMANGNNFGEEQCCVFAKKTQQADGGQLALL